MIALIINFSVAEYLDREPSGKGVDNGHPHTVETAGNFVSAAAEFTAGVEHGESHFHGGSAGAVEIHGNAAAVVQHGNAFVLMDGDKDLGAVAGQRFVNAVIDDLIDEMMKTAFAGIADVHTGANADRFQSFQNLNLLGSVFRNFFWIFCHSVSSWSVFLENSKINKL